MATKINTAYYGAEDTWTAATSSWGTAAKRVDSSHTFMQLAKNGLLDLDNESLFDLSCVPWGLPRCSVASGSYPLFLSTGAVSSFLGYFTPENENLDTQNNALCIVSGGGFANSTGSGQSLSTSRLKQKQRIIGKTKYNSNTIASSLAADNNGDLGSDSYYGQGIVTYLDYQKTKVIIDTVTFIDKSSTASSISNNGNLKAIAFKDIPAAIENNEINDDWQVNCFACRFVVNNDLSSNGTIHPTFASKHKVPLHVKNTYSNGELTEWVQVQRNIISSIGRAFGQNTVNAIVKRDTIDTLGSSNSYVCSGDLTAYSNMSEYRQRFDDIEYNWICANRYATGSDVYWGEYGDPIVNASMRYFSLLKTNGESIADVQKAILHEVAFLGFPFIIDEQYVSENIGGEHVYLPVFDEHMMTTGKYKIGAAAADLDNAAWGDIFDNSMPEYDPNYNPPEPEPEEDDKGDLYNIGSRRFFWNNLNVHLLPVANYGQFIQKLNALNMTDPDNETWRLEFKGLNPSDYIVGAYVSFVKPPKTTATTIMLGPVDMEQTEYVYDDSSSNAGFFTFGTRDVLPFYYDFRDYEPYTKVEVYLPLCGTVELETAYFMGAALKIDYYYDIYTMSCTACLYRVKQGQELLYKTVNGTIGAQIPMLAANMGAYQNQIKSVENALKQNELKLMTSTAALAAGVIAAPLTSGTSLLAAGTAALSGAAGLASSIQKQTELEYQIEHLQPSISITGSADPQTSLCVGQLMPKLIIKRPKMLPDYDQEYYAKTIGHACCINDILGGTEDTPRTGLTVCSSVDTSGISMLIGDNTYISPTAEEVNMIKQALASGVIL
ncbi:MAG: hypothetical protein J6T62_07460 [Fibrobacter sp.]|nr:hypothetical protein [Fibrobacter sp.]